MPIDAAFVTDLVWQSLTAPRPTFRRILGWAGGFRTALGALALVAVLSAILSSLLSLITDPTGNAEMDALLAQPIQLALMQFGGMAIAAGLMTALGRLFGGKGRLDQAIFLLAWLEFLLITLQIALILVLLALPALGGPVILICGAGAVWLFANALAELHGFRSAWATMAFLLGFVMLASILVTLIIPR